MVAPAPAALARRAAIAQSGAMTAHGSTLSENEKTLDDALRSLFSAVQTRALPDSLRYLIDQLEEASTAAVDRAAA